MKLIKAPMTLKIDKTLSVFLAGSIELGVAEPWQDKVITALQDDNITILNPRRDSWGSSWKQHIEDPKFNEQVNWELEALEKSDLIIMYFDRKTKSPITLLELGLFARSKKLIVCCPEGFWRKGNVDIVCAKYGVKQVESLEELISAVKDKLK